MDGLIYRELTLAGHVANVQLIKERQKWGNHPAQDKPSNN